MYGMYIPDSDNGNGGHEAQAGHSCPRTQWTGVFLDGGHGHFCSVCHNEALKPVQRVATEEDIRMRRYYWDKEKEAFPICEQKIREHGLDMKLVNVEYNLTGSKVVFYFTADDRVDFRELEYISWIN